MADLESRISELREQVSAAQQRKARADHELAVARASEEAALRALKDEFGAATVQAARALLEQVSADLAAACAEAEKALEEAEAGDGSTAGGAGH